MLFLTLRNLYYVRHGEHSNNDKDKTKDRKIGGRNNQCKRTNPRPKTAILSKKIQNIKELFNKKPLQRRNKQT